MEGSSYKYYAFISYSSRDTEWGKRVQRKLEHYRMPSTLCREHGWNRTPINPVFFAPTDIQPGELTEELQERLKASRNLIVICSPSSARSDWVGKEILFFHQLGRTKRIFFFIVDGKPHSGDPDTECFHPILETMGLPEILGANIHERIYRYPWLNRERAYVQIVSKLLGVEFDSIWRRHRRLLVQKMLAFVAGFVAVMAALAVVWAGNQPVEVSVTLEEAARNDKLPSRGDARVSLQLKNEIKTKTVLEGDTNVVFNNIPHRYLNRPVKVSVSCPAFLDLDTTLPVLKKSERLRIRRDPSVYGHIRFRLWDYVTEAGVPDVPVEIAGYHVTSDAKGFVEVSVPLALQRPYYLISTSVPLVRDTLFPPCGTSYVVEVAN